MLQRATSTTWAIRRMKALGVSEAELVEFWKSEGRVQLEYACPVWHSSLTVVQSSSLDRAQCVAMAGITGRWEPSHTQQLLDLGLDRLGSRRELISKRFAERTARDSRHTDMFTAVQTNTRRGAQGEPMCRDKGQNSNILKFGPTLFKPTSQKVVLPVVVDHDATLFLWFCSPHILHKIEL